MNKIYIFIVIFFLGNLACANDVINDYVNIGLQSNLALKQQEISLEQSLQVLKEARGLFLPTLEINARYSRAGGGRTIDFPIGDFMNPVYQTLNQMLGQQRFPQLENETINFLREKEHETKIRLAQPIFQPAIYYNYKAKSDLTDLQNAELDVFKRNLTAEIKMAYYNYLKSIQVVNIYKDVQSLLTENLRISKKLFENQKVTKDVILRAKTEMSSVEQKIMSAENQQKLAASYFNFLLNRPLDTDINIDTNLTAGEIAGLDYEGVYETAIQKREELHQLQYAINAAGNGASALKSNYLPGLTAVLDYGYQGEEYKFGKDDDYWMGSVVLQWNLFKGFQDHAKIEYATLEQKKLQIQFDQLKQQIALQVRQAYDNYKIAQKTVEVAQEQLGTSRESYKIINKKYEQGMVPYIEFLDARTNLTESEINLALTKYDYSVKCTELEKVAGISNY